MEIKAIPGHPGYHVSDSGVVFSDLSGRMKALRIFKVLTNKSYEREVVQLGRGVNCKVHRLVCMTFHGAPPSRLHIVAHLNGDSLDNRAENLAWKSQRENEADKLLHGTSNRGARHGMSKLTAEKVKEIRRLRSEGVMQKDIATKFEISQTTVSQIVRGKLWGWLE